MLSTSSWFYFGTGELYGAPFMTRCLLYRLHDINCFILVYHKQNVTSVEVSDQMREQAMRDVGPLNEPFRLGHIVAAKHYPVTEVFVHHVDSSTAALSALAGSPPIRLELSDKTSPQCELGKTNVILERVQLPCKEMFSAFPGRGGQFEQRISETPYWVKGPVVVVNMGEKFEQQVPGAQDAKMRCWKVSVGNLSRKEFYDFSPSRKWSLSALQVEEDWKVESAMYLEKRNDFNDLAKKKDQYPFKNS